MHVASKRTALILVLGLALLSGGLLLLLRHASPLPAYDLVLEGGRAEFLNGQSVLRLRADTRLSITLRPRSAVTQRVFVLALMRQGAAQQRWPVFFDQTAHGTLRLQGTAQELLPSARGRLLLTIYLGSQPIPWIVAATCPAGWLRRLLPQLQTLRAEVSVDEA